jgi:hypothetical protein
VLLEVHFSSKVKRVYSVSAERKVKGGIEIQMELSF